MARKKTYNQSRIEIDEITMSTSSKTTSELDVRGTVLIGLRFPASMTSTAMSAEVTDEIGDNADWRDYYDSNGNQVTFTVPTSTNATQVGFIADDFAGCQYLRFTSLSTSNESTDRTIETVLRAL